MESSRAKALDLFVVRSPLFSEFLIAGRNLRGEGEISMQFYTNTSDWRSPFYFWRMPVSILEAENALGGMLWRRRGPTRQGRVTLDFRQWLSSSRGVFRTSFAVNLAGNF